MPESLSFHFEGALADERRMNFYESARFQYAAARLMVKLAQFRRRGSFSQKITSTSNVGIQLVTQTDGSFNINVEVPDQGPGDGEFVKISVGDLIAYLSERIVEKLDQQALQDIVPPDRRTRPGSTSDAALDQLVENAMAGESMTVRLPVLVQDSVKRRVAEAYRERRLTESRCLLHSSAKWRLLYVGVPKVWRSPRQQAGNQILFYT
jgi:hypothetical protein